MKILTYVLLVLMCCMLVTCTVDNPWYSNHYQIAFFLDEESFTFGGTMVEHVTTDPSGPDPVPFDSAFVRLQRRGDHWDEPYEGWETRQVPMINDTFEITISVTENGITLNNEMLSKPHEYSTPWYWPSDLANTLVGVELQFYGTRGEAHYNLGVPYYPERTNMPNTIYDYDYYSCDYIYVAEPIDLSMYERTEGDSRFGYKITTYDYDLNFTKPGWYKVVTASRKNNSEAELSSPTNTVFLVYD